MEHSQGPNYNNKISIESRKSNFSISKSLGRPSWELKDPSLGKKASLIYVMSIQSERNSDIYEKLLESDKKPKNRTSNILQSSYNQNGPNQFYPYTTTERNSDINGMNPYEIQHQCTCGLDCNEYECPCYQAKGEICIKGSCCTNCIHLKSVSLRRSFIENREAYNNNNNEDQQYLSHNNYANINNNNYPQQEFSHNQQQLICNCKNTECLKSYCKCFQNGGFCSNKCGCESCKNKFESQQRDQALQAIKSNGEVIFCTCKKTKCNKKYCSCYAAGIKCGKLCSCESCTNCIKEDPSMDIQVYEGQEEEDYRNIEMPDKMSFEPVRFS